ncbi:MAG: ubiquitin-like domain-containing protein [Candidatus Saccharimonadales bacterium]
MIFIFVPKGLHAENERVITIYHDGIEQTFVTDATTVAEVLERTQIPLSEHDAVEPARGTQLVAPSYNINIYRARPVNIVDGAQRYQVMTPHTSGRTIAEGAGLKVYPEDEFHLERINNFVREGGVGLKLTIDRATPFTFVLYGKVVQARTQATTVGELLKEKGVNLQADDRVTPAADSPTTEGMTVVVYREGSQVVTEEQDVSFETENIQDADREVGYRQVKTPGVLGKKVVTYQIELRDGKEIGRTEIQSVVTVEPKKQVEIVGTKTNGFSGGFGEALARLRQCEAGGRYDRNSGNGYYGAYQYNLSTWANYAGYHYPHEAPPAIQDQKAHETYQRRGWQPWPGCTRKLSLQDIYR